MKAVIEILEERISAAMAEVAGQKAPAIVRPATDAKFGDYQANGVMALAKQLKTDPRKLAEDVVEKSGLDDICLPPEVAGPGFINLRLKPEFVAANLLQINKDADRLGIEKVDKPQTIVVDFSGPNIAKQMHVGHLRSTIIGDCICRLLEFAGHKVIRQNHIGDWGTQFGMLIARIFKRGKEEALVGKRAGVIPTHLHEFEDLYKEAQQDYDTDEEFRDLSRAAIAALHAGDRTWLGRWQVLVKQSKRHYQQLYERLNVTLKEEHIRGESAYKDDLPKIVEDLKKRKFAVESEGAICIFPPGFKNKEGEALPLIVQKSDGAYLYATTDLAALRYRIDKLKANRIIYVTDARQQLHFAMVFATAKMANWAKDTELVHVTFGSVLGENGKPLKTREGENVKLKELLDEAVERAKAIVEEKNPNLKPDKKEQIAKAVGIGAVKYADYSNNRTSDYIFSFDKMLAMDGNTAPYMQYAYARIKSIERKAQTKQIPIENELVRLKTLSLSEPDELDLAKHLIRYGEAIEAAASDYRPNYLTAYLYELAQKFSVFYTNCPVLDAGPDKRPTRLLLCDLTARTIRHGLSTLLGIEVVEQM
jgi:arginyl-tRNA synthetase